MRSKLHGCNSVMSSSFRKVPKSPEPGVLVPNYKRFVSRIMRNSDLSICKQQWQRLVARQYILISAVIAHYLYSKIAVLFKSEFQSSSSSL